MQVVIFSLNKCDCSWFQFSQNWSFFATRKKTNLCSHYEHKFYARNPQKAEAFLRGKPLPGNTPKARKLKMLIMWIRNFAIYLLWAKQKSILKNRNINIANNFLRFSFFDFFIKKFFSCILTRYEFSVFKILILFFSRIYFFAFSLFNTITTGFFKFKSYITQVKKSKSTSLAERMWLSKNHDSVIIQGFRVFPNERFWFQNGT